MFQCFHVQVGRNQRGLSPQNPLIDTEEKLGYGKGIGKLCSQIINNEQIAVENIRISFPGGLCPVMILAKYSFGEQLK